MKQLRIVGKSDCEAPWRIKQVTAELNGFMLASGNLVGFTHLYKSDHGEQ